MSTMTSTNTDALHRSTMSLVRFMELSFDFAHAGLVLYCVIYSIPSQSFLWTSIATTSVSAIVLTLHAGLHLRCLNAHLHRAKSRVRQLDTEHLVLMSENDDLTSTLIRTRVRELRLEADCVELREELDGWGEAVERLQTVREKLLRVCADRDQAVQDLEQTLRGKDGAGRASSKRSRVQGQYCGGCGGDLQRGDGDADVQI